MGWNRKGAVFSFSKMLVLGDIVLLWSGMGGWYSNTSQAACQAVNIDSAVVLLVCDMAEWWNNWAACIYIVDFSLFVPHRRGGPCRKECSTCAVIRSYSFVCWIGLCYELCIHQGSRAVLRMCSTLFQPKLKNHTEKREREREREKDDGSWGWSFYLHLQPLSHK